MFEVEPLPLKAVNKSGGLKAKWIHSVSTNQCHGDSQEADISYPAHKTLLACNNLPAASCRSELGGGATKQDFPVLTSGGRIERREGVGSIPAG